MKIDTGRKRIQLSASESLNAFVGWLTTRDEVTKLGASENCAGPCELIKMFCEAHKLDDPRDGWEYIMVNMSEWVKAHEQREEIKK